MTREQEERNKQQARQAAQCDWNLGREPRARWWVGELSYRLGIVDSHGVIDVDGEVARDFSKRYAREYSKARQSGGWGSLTNG